MVGGRLRNPRSSEVFVYLLMYLFDNSGCSLEYFSCTTAVGGVVGGTWAEHAVVKLTTTQVVGRHSYRRKIESAGLELTRWEAFGSLRHAVVLSISTMEARTIPLAAGHNINIYTRLTQCCARPQGASESFNRTSSVFNY